MDLKTCTKCKQAYPLSGFGKKSAASDGLNPWCRKCHSACSVRCQKNRTPEQKAARLEKSRIYKRSEVGRAKWREQNYRRKYGITVAAFNFLLLQQDSKCAICERTFGEKLFVDHNHQTGKVRGLLCFSCNVGLGCFSDNIMRLKNSIAYLEHHENQRLESQPKKPTKNQRHRAIGASSFA